MALNREMIFELFWREKGIRSGGWLGLANAKKPWARQRVYDYSSARPVGDDAWLAHKARSPQQGRGDPWSYQGA
jgi:hypothetical protein